MIKTIFIVITILILVLIVHRILNTTKNIRIYKNEKHFCNKCKLGYITNLEELNYKYCPYCGQELDYHEKFEA